MLIQDVPPDLRANIDYVICLRDNIKTNRERIYRYFAGVFPSFSAFDETMQACTKGYECMVLDQTSLSYNISDCIYWYKATPDLQYRVGAEQYWNFSEGQKLEDTEDSSDEDDTRQRSRHREVTVNKRYPDPEPPSSSRYGATYKQMRRQW